MKQRRLTDAFVLMHNITHSQTQEPNVVDLTVISSRNRAIHAPTLQFSFFFLVVFFPWGPQWCLRTNALQMWGVDGDGIDFAMKINSCAMSSKWVEKDWQLLFICYGNQCLPGDESTANTPLLISQFLPCMPETGDREGPELLSVKSSTVTTDRPSSPRQLTSSEVGVWQHITKFNPITTRATTFPWMWLRWLIMIKSWFCCWSIDGGWGQSITQVQASLHRPGPPLHCPLQVNEASFSLWSLLLLHLIFEVC